MLFAIGYRLSCIDDKADANLWQIVGGGPRNDDIP
jgi:hypothetical protein